MTNFTTEHIYDDGEFYIKVMSRDRTKQSKPVTFVIDNKNNSAEKLSNLDLNSVSKHLTVHTPSNNQIYYTSMKNTIVDFSFGINEDIRSSGLSYFLVIQDSKGQLVSHDHIAEPGAEINLDVGVYKWAFTTIANEQKNLSPLPTVSGWKKLEVRSNKRFVSSNLSKADFLIVLKENQDLDVQYELK